MTRSIGRLGKDGHSMGGSLAIKETRNRNQARELSMEKEEYKLMFVFVF